VFDGALSAKRSGSKNPVGATIPGILSIDTSGDGEAFLENGPEAKPAAVPTKTRGKKMVNNFILAECV
jgi:hypothetical protein